METKFSLYLAILKNALMSLFLLLSNGDVSDAATDSKTVAPVVEKTAAPTVDKTTTPVVDKTTAPVVEKTTAPVVEKTAAPTVDKTTTPVVDKTTAPVVDKTAAPVVEKTTAPVVEKTTAPVVYKTTAPVVDKTTAPVVDKTTAPVVDKTTAPVVDKTTAPVVDKTTAPVVDKTTAPVVDKTTAPVVDKTTAPVVDKTTAPVVDKTAALTADKTVAATGANMVVDAIKKDAPVPTPGSPEALKAELLAELKVVLKEQVEKTVSAKMANPNAPVSVVSNASQTDAKPADTKAIAQNAAASVVAGGGHGTPCNMLTSATCGQNSTDCLIFKGYCLPKCDALSVDVCEKTPNCQLSGIVTKKCALAT